MTILNISLPEQMQNWVESQINSGYYIDYSDYIRDLIRRDLQQNSLIQSLIEGEESGVSDKTVDDIWTDVKNKHRND